MAWTFRSQSDRASVALGWARTSPRFVRPCAAAEDRGLPWQISAGRRTARADARRLRLLAPSDLPRTGRDPNDRIRLGTAPARARRLPSPAGVHTGTIAIVPAQVCGGMDLEG